MHTLQHPPCVVTHELSAFLNHEALQQAKHENAVDAAEAAAIQDNFDRYRTDTYLPVNSEEWEEMAVDVYLAEVAEDDGFSLYFGAKSLALTTPCPICQQKPYHAYDGGVHQYTCENESCSFADWADIHLSKSLVQPSFSQKEAAQKWNYGVNQFNQISKEKEKYRMDIKNIEKVELNILKDFSLNSEGANPYIQALRDEVDNMVSSGMNMDNKDDRAKVRSFAAKIPKFKNKLDGIWKDRVSELAKKKNEVDAARRKMRNEMDALKLKVREPLTNWEKAEKEREQAILSRIKQLEGMKQSIPSLNLNGMQDLLSQVEQVVIDERYGSDKQQSESSVLRNNIIDSLKTEIKLELLRIEKVKEIEKLEAEKRERERIEQEKKRERERIEQEKKRAEEVKELEARMAEKARLAEVKRQEELKAKREAAKAKREANEKHVNEVMTSARQAIVSLGVSSANADKILNAIKNGEIPNISINF